MGFWSRAGLDSMGALPGEITVIEIYCTIYRPGRILRTGGQWQGWIWRGQAEIDRFRFA